MKSASLTLDRADSAHSSAGFRSNMKLPRRTTHSIGGVYLRPQRQGGGFSEATAQAAGKPDLGHEFGQVDVFARPASAAVLTGEGTERSPSVDREERSAVEEAATRREEGAEETETRTERTVEESGEAPAAPAPRTVIRGPRELWYFTGETPPDYTVSARLSTNKTGGTFRWDVSAQLGLSSATEPLPTVSTRNLSAARNDAWVRVRHTDTRGNLTAASYRLTVLAPDSLTHLNDVDAADPVWGYDCQIHYSIHDQFGTVLPRNVPINEQWTSGVVADFAGMNWRRGAEGSATVAPTNWFDHVNGETAGHNPAPVNPGTPNAGVAVYHWSGDWRVGSLTIGRGRRVRSVTWQKNRGFARHI